MTARKAVVAACSWDPFQHPKLDTNPDVNETPAPVQKYITLVKHSSIAELPNEHWADSHCKPGVKAELKPVSEM